MLSFPAKQHEEPRVGGEYYFPAGDLPWGSDYFRNEARR